ncbi:NmrA/HSCARG family protein [Kutzneria buriramensis]|uniref:Uncharacterized protein YbjT (DUF2867 family) n=1 Tax=Kutzneria buriramensis TaxID=1045776 RepID=A0A3E0HKE6_9PSEU|nr:NmrA/HSCARG family protein [Kutzneria buriramensis]REH46943.1 uncharacterized protein YbjT (DUF2867 family) [Kutzneria buriramensis]
MPDVLVTGATGRQGGATARALLAAGVPIRALVRDPSTDRARALAAQGAELVVGDLHDLDSLRRAADGVRTAFSVQMPAFTSTGPDFDGEVRQAINLIEAAKAAGVQQFVHTSVTGAGQHAGDPAWGTAIPSLDAKSTIQDHLRAADFPLWTLLKPGFFMENFLPSMAFLFPRGIDGGLVTVLKPQTRLSLVAVHDIGVAAAAAIADPTRFHRVELELASDYRSMNEVAAILARVLGHPLSAPDMTIAEALAAGMPPMGAAHDRINAVGQPARPEFARAFDIPVTSFETWAAQHLPK